MNVESEPGRSPVGNMSRTSGNAALEPASITFYSRGENLVFASKKHDVSDASACAENPFPIMILIFFV